MILPHIYIYGKIKALFQTTNQYYRIAMTVHFFPLPTHVGHPKKRLQLLLIVNLEVSKFGKAVIFGIPSHLILIRGLIINIAA